jgi:hypothetical protein
VKSRKKEVSVPCVLRTLYRVLLSVSFAHRKEIPPLSVRTSALTRCQVLPHLFAFWPHVTDFGQAVCVVNAWACLLSSRFTIFTRDSGNELLWNGKVSVLPWEAWSQRRKGRITPHIHNASPRRRKTVSVNSLTHSRRESPGAHQFESLTAPSDGLCWGYQEPTAKYT